MTKHCRKPSHSQLKRKSLKSFRSRKQWLERKTTQNPYLAALNLSKEVEKKCCCIPKEKWGTTCSLSLQYVHVPTGVVLNWNAFFFYFPVTTLYDYVFSENGLVAYKNGELFHRQVSGIIIFILVSPYKWSEHNSSSVRIFYDQLMITWGLQ